MPRLSVQDWMSKAVGSADGSLPDEPPPRVVLVTSSARSDDSANVWVADEVLEKLGQQNLQVAAFRLGEMKLAPCAGCHNGGSRVCRIPCDRNDPESEVFDPHDDIGLVHEKLTDIDALILIGELRDGGLDSSMQRFIERLQAFRNVDEDNPLRGKTAGAIVIGTATHPAALTGPLFTLGLGVPANAAFTWNLSPNISSEVAARHFKQDQQLHAHIEGLVSAVVRSVASNSR